MTRSVNCNRSVVTESTSAYLPKVSNPTGYPSGPRDVLVSNDGRDDCGNPLGPFDSCDVWVSMPESWEDVTFRLRGKTGTAWAELGVGTFRAARGADRANSMNLQGILFSHRGDPCDEYILEGYNTAVDHATAQAEGQFIIRLWNCASQRVVEPYAENSNVVTGSEDIADSSGGPTVLLVEPDSGGQLFVSDLDLSVDDATAHEVTLYSQVGVGGPLTRVFSWWVSLDAPIVEPFNKPVPLPPGARAVIDTDLTGAGPVVKVNAVAFVG